MLQVYETLTRLTDCDNLGNKRENWLVVITEVLSVVFKARLCLFTDTLYTQLGAIFTQM